MTRKPSKQSDATPTAQVAQLMGEMTEVALAGQVMGLKILAAEMEALSHVIPGLVGAEPQAGVEGRTDAEIEADFDNMPV
ncbi:hypothetical protein MCEREM30_02305 [Paracoccaceae bacterium]